MELTSKKEQRETQLKRNAFFLSLHEIFLRNTYPYDHAPSSYQISDLNFLNQRNEFLHYIYQQIIQAKKDQSCTIIHNIKQQKSRLSLRPRALLPIPTIKKKEPIKNENSKKQNTTIDKKVLPPISNYLKVVSTEITPWICLHCSKKTSSYITLFKHIQEECCKGEKAFGCLDNKCNLLFERPSIVIHHLADDHHEYEAHKIYCSSPPMQKRKFIKP